MPEGYGPVNHANQSSPFSAFDNRIKYNDIDWNNKLNKLKKGFQTTKSGKILCKILF